MNRLNNKSFLNKRNIIWASLWLAQILTFYLLSLSEVTVQYFVRFYEWQKAFHQSLFSSFTTSVGDILYILLIVGLVYKLYLIIKKKSQSSVIQLLISLNILYFVYQIFWGMMYFQPPIMQVDTKKEIPIEKLKSLSIKYLKLCIQDREVLNENKSGVFELNNFEQSKTDIIAAQSKIPSEFNQKQITNLVNLKPSIYSHIMSYTGILGYYNPFSGEAQYDANLPDSYKAFTLSHEAAHQLGYAREQEASFIGFLTCQYSDKAELRYSANLYALKNILINIQQVDPNWVKTILEQYSQKMRRDRNNELAFRDQHDSILSSIFSWTNNLFLKSNRQEGSVTYNYFIYLLLNYET